MIDPYILTYYNCAWYVKAFCHLKKDIRIFAIHRINKTELTKYTFETDHKIVTESTNGKPLFLFDEVSDVEVYCSKEIAGYVIEQSKTRGQKITENEDGSVVVHIPSAPKLDIIKWVLFEGGEAKVIKPEWLWKEVKSQARKIISP